MPIKSDDAKDIITVLRREFENSPGMGPLAMGYHTRMDAAARIVYTTEDYRSRLSPLLTNKINVAAPLLRHYKSLTQSALRNDIRHHLEPVGSLAREETAADRLEVWEAHAALQIDKQGMLREDIHSAQTTDFFFAGWMDMVDYEALKRGEGETSSHFVDREKAHKKAFFPFRILRKNQKVVFFLEDDERTLTIGACHFKLPVMDMLERYGKSYDVDRDDKERMLRIYRSHFAGLRSGQSFDAEGQSSELDGDLEVWLLDDGVNITHVVDKGGDYFGANAKLRYPVVGDGVFPNPFGQVSLLLAEGTYNYGLPTAYRREPILKPLIDIEDQRAVMKSNFASQAASPPWPYEELPWEVFQLDKDKQPEPMQQLLDDFGRPIPARGVGKLGYLQTEVAQNADKIYEIFTQEARTVSPQNLLAEPSQFEDVAASVVLAMKDDYNQRLGYAIGSEMRLWDRAFTMMEHAMGPGLLNKHRKGGEPENPALDWVLGFVSSGAEKLIGRKVPRGKRFELKPQDLDIEYTRTLEPLDNRLATVAARRAEADARWAAGTILPDERLEMHGVEDLEEFKVKYNAAQLYQADVPAIIMEARQNYAEFIAARDGRDIAEVMAEVESTPVNAPPAAGAGGSQGVVRFGAPVQEAPQSTSTASAAPQ